MEKLLSIVIPSYNMEAYLSRCLDSLILEDKELMDKLDIIVVNDGSKDSTSEIAHSYADRFPNSIRVIDKENGHYGSCINAALPIATGKYFRILDADDWFDKNGLKEVLIKLKFIDTDVVCTHYTEHNPEGEKPDDFEAPIYDESIDLYKTELPVGFYIMHMIMYRTSHLRRINYRQSEGICYTDAEYVFYPLFLAQNVIFLNISLYQYFIGRDDQSMNSLSLYKNRNHFKIIAERMIKEKDKFPDKNLVFKKLFFRKVVWNITYYYYYSLIVHFPNKREVQEVKNSMNFLRTAEPEIYWEVMNRKLMKLPLFRIWKFSPLLAWLPIKLIMVRK